MIVTIHQPNFFPWVGFFDKIRKADVFVSLDTVPYTKGGFQNRVKIAGASGPDWLTVPVKSSGKMGQPTNEVETDDLKDWARVHLAKLDQLYRKTPGFAALMPQVRAIYEVRPRKLVDLNVAGIKIIFDRLGLTTRFVSAATLGCEGTQSELLLNICKSLGATVYLSGPSGRDYLNESLFKAANIEVQYHSFKQPAYPQIMGDLPFQGGLSALDYLFCQPGLESWRSSAPGT